jgi:hypothetical protein
MRGARWGHDHLARAMDALYAFHPQAQPAGEDLESLLLELMNMVRTSSPAGLADPIYLEQLAARILGGLPEHGPQPRHRVD